MKKSIYTTGYVVNKYAGRVLCGNGLFDTFEACVEFADDGFCTRAEITNMETGEKKTIRFKHPEDKETRDAEVKALAKEMAEEIISSPKHYSRNPLDDIDLEEEDEDAEM